jgi:hypothetical protein
MDFGDSFYSPTLFSLLFEFPQTPSAHWLLIVAVKEGVLGFPKEV